MILFALIGAALVLGVLAWILRPLLRRAAGQAVARGAANVSIYRDQFRELESDLAVGTLARADYVSARTELEKRLLEDVGQPDVASLRPTGRHAALVVGAVVPLLAVGLYLLVGNPGAVNREAQVQASAAQIQAMVGRLAARLRDNPDDVDGWKLLGRSYAVLGRFDESADAYAKAAVRAPRDASLLADLADALAMARGQSLQGEPEKLVLRALEIEPGNLKALALAGTAAFERKDYAGAAGYWQRMLPHVSANSEEARTIQQNVNEAQSLAASSSKRSPLRGTVSLSPQFKAQAAPEDTVFVFARAVEGPPMPLAVARTKVRDLPYRFQLDDSMAMAPGMKLSAFPTVVVTARISKSGTATPQAGDLQGASAPVPSDSGAVSVLIDNVVK